MRSDKSDSVFLTVMNNLTATITPLVAAVQPRYPPPEAFAAPMPSAFQPGPFPAGPSQPYVPPRESGALASPPRFHDFQYYKDN